MPKSPFERKLDKIQSELMQFKENNDAIIDSIEEEILLLQRFVAKGSVTSMANTCIETVRKLKDQTVKDEVERKLIVEFISTKSKIGISETPLEIATEFNSKCSKKIHDLGLHFLNDSL